MADTAMDFVIDNLKQLLRENTDLIGAIRDDVKSLLEELQNLHAFLKQATKSRSRNEILKHLVKELSTAVNEAEVCIDKFVIEAKLHQNKGIRKMFDFGHVMKARQCATEIKFIKEKLKEIRRENAYHIQFEDHQNVTDQELRKVPLPEEEDVVGFDEEAAEIINRLCKGSDDLEIIPIVGMPGLGKTTLANKIFKDGRVQYEFFTCFWVYVAQSYNRREVFLNIISKFTRNVKQYEYEAEEDLAKAIRELLGKGGKYLIVLDDIWTLEALNELKIAFPNNHKGNKIMLTTRNSSLANSCNNFPHKLKFLTESECWLLLKKKVFRKDECPLEFEELGRLIARKCRGLPLATVVIAGCLIGKYTRREWELVHQCVGEHIFNRDYSITKKLVQMSYDSLPFNLKVCFLYLGAFPRGFEIPVWKLVRLWIAEGFIPDQRPLILESVAEEYLNELVNKNLLMVMQRTSNGQTKTCRVHDMLHEFCRLEASEENIFKEIKLGVEQSFPRNQELATYRRLCIDSSVVEFISRKPYGEGIRSFLCFSSEKITKPAAEVGTIPKAFPLLRVFDVEAILFSKFQKQFFQLYLLRYIALSSASLAFIPKYIEDLWNLQTFIISTQQTTLHIQADICNMPQLRHFHTNTPAKLCRSAAIETNKPTSVHGTLQTLSTIEPESCTEYVFARCQYLKKLGIRGKIEVLFQANRVGPFLNNQNLKYLEKLKLVNDLSAGGKLHLRSENVFPKSLKKLTLLGTGLDWNEMGRLCKLEVLEVLKLKENAFTGELWESMVDTFPSLKVLLIERSDLVSWKASSEQFPRLVRLVLRSLHKLEEVPIELAKIRNLQLMELENTTKTAAESAREVKSCSVCTGFKLSIFPPDL
ncbi:putative late blight resistance protein homolog R1A-10 [Nicotiana tabacum]|uniref:Late blight resistance protein homolog R1A-10 n=2 Tax=Nicotiana tabacum TaxID=4097 RepID=A0A1S3Y8P2_TOBAC|nr:PREDICTED: putative late blight resistance protein homolog R1A-10 [Nicotiana tabacum]